jgi:hypothetical protein
MSPTDVPMLQFRRGWFLNSGRYLAATTFLMTSYAIF